MKITMQNLGRISPAYTYSNAKQAQATTNPIAPASTAQASVGLMDKNYAQLAIHKHHSVSFGEADPVDPQNSDKVNGANVPAVVKPEQTLLEKKIGLAIQVMGKNDLVVVGSDIKSAQKALKDASDFIPGLVSKIFFIKDEKMKKPIAINMDDKGVFEAINIDKDPFTIATKPHPIKVAPGQAAMMFPDDKILMNGQKFGVNFYSPKNNETYPTEGISVFDFSKLDTKAVSNLNLRHFEQLVKDKMNEKGQKKITFADVGGQDEVINKLKESIIYPIKYPAAYKNIDLNKGTILTGPPGTGKTLIAKAVANEVDANFFEVNAASLQDKFVGGSEKNWRELFEKAIENQPSIIFIDEMEAACGKRVGSDTSRYDDKVVDQILSLMSDLEKSDNQVYVIAATNKLDMLDGAITRSGRFGTQVKVDLPNKEGCSKILDIYTKDKPVSEKFDDKKFAQNLFDTKVVGADIMKIVNDAHSNAYGRVGIYEKMANGTFKEADIDGLRIEPQDFKKSLDDFKAQAQMAQPTIKHNQMGFIQKATDENKSVDDTPLPIKDEYLDEEKTA